MGSPIILPRQVLPGIVNGSNVVDFTSYVSASATAALVLLYNTNGSNRYDVGTRKPGGAVLAVGDIDADGWSWVAVPFDGSKNGEIFVQNNNVECIVAGEFGPEWFWFDDAIDLSGQVTVGQDNVISVGGQPGAPTAEGAWIVAQASGGAGDTYEFNNGLSPTQSPRRDVREQFQHAVGTPGEQFTAYLDTVGGLWCHGVCSGGVTWTADKYTNDDAPTATDGTFEDVLTLSGGEEAVFWDHRTDTVTARYGTQPKGAGYDLVWAPGYKIHGFRQKAFSCEGPGADDAVQGARTHSSIRFYRVGIVDPSSASTPLNPESSSHGHAADSPGLGVGVVPAQARHAHPVDEATVAAQATLSITLVPINASSDVANRTINWVAWTLADYNARNFGNYLDGQDVSSAGGILTLSVVGSPGVIWHVEGKDIANAQLYIGEVTTT